jgi:predicted RNA binding protein YcfA (HicA-like mRNA interferase family)
MSDRLSSITSQKALRKLKKAGFQEHHQRGSHLVLKHSDGRIVVLPANYSDKI